MTYLTNKETNDELVRDNSRNNTPPTKSQGESKRGKIVQGLETGHLNNNTSDSDTNGRHGNEKGNVPSRVSSIRRNGKTNTAHSIKTMPDTNVQKPQKSNNSLGEQGDTPVMVKSVSSPKKTANRSPDTNNQKSPKRIEIYMEGIRVTDLSNEAIDFYFICNQPERKILREYMHLKNKEGIKEGLSLALEIIDSENMLWGHAIKKECNSCGASYDEHCSRCTCGSNNFKIKVCIDKEELKEAIQKEMKHDNP